MKITKDTQTVWRFENGHMIIGTSFGYYLVMTGCYLVMKRTKSQMIELYGLTNNQFDNIEKSGI